MRRLADRSLGPGERTLAQPRVVYRDGMWRDSSGDKPLPDDERPALAYHTSSSANRDSIRLHGLDWERMGAAPGLASGLNVPEEPAIFLARDLGEARLFAGMPRDRDPEDIWAVRPEGLDILEVVEGWVYCPTPIPADRLRLIETDLDPVEIRREQDDAG